MNTSQKAHLDALTRQTYSPVASEEFVSRGDNTFMAIFALAVVGLLVMLFGVMPTLKGVVAGLTAWAALHIILRAIDTMLMDPYEELNK